MTEALAALIVLAIVGVALGAGALLAAIRVLHRSDIKRDRRHVATENAVLRLLQESHLSPEERREYTASIVRER